MFLEDEGRLKDAENAFLLAGKPKEAILMYVHNENWAEALSVAEKHDQQSVSEVLIGQAKVLFERKEYAKSESLLLRAQRPDIAISFYKSAGMWQEASKFAREYLPSKLAELQDEEERFSSGRAIAGKDETLASARKLEALFL